MSRCCSSSESVSSSLSPWQKVERDQVLRLRIARHIEDDDARKAVIAKEYLAVFARERFTRRRAGRIHVDLHTRADPRQPANRLSVGCQRAQDGTKRLDDVPALPEQVAAAARCDDVAVRIDFTQAGDGMVALDRDAKALDGESEHVEHARRGVGERVDAPLALLECKKTQVRKPVADLLRAVLAQDARHEVRGVVVLGDDRRVGEVAASVACGENLLADSILLLVNGHLGTRSRRRDGSGKPRSPSSDYCNFAHVSPLLSSRGAWKSPSPIVAGRKHAFHRFFSWVRRQTGQPLAKHTTSRQAPGQKTAKASPACHVYGQSLIGLSRRRFYTSAGSASRCRSSALRCCSFWLEKATAIISLMRLS